MKETPSTFKALLSTAFLFLTLGLLTVNFQNCSGLSSADYGSSNDTVSQGAGGLVTVDDRVVGVDDPSVESGGLTATFSSGERFTGQALVSQGSFLDKLIEILKYETYSQGKAIAMAETGLGYAAFTGESDDEAERMAIESCNLLSGQSCALIVSGDLFTVDSTTAFKDLEYRLSGFEGSVFNRDEIPMSSTRVRASYVVNNFINAPGHRALALSPAGGAFAVFTTKNSITVEEAGRMALQRCELEASLLPCILYAVDDKVVFKAGSWIKSSSINYSNNNAAALPPPASREESLNDIKDLIAETKRENYAVYITPSGYGYFGRHKTDVEEAKKQALGYCESGADSSRCIFYASSKGVHIGPDDLYAKQNYPDLLCKTVRYNCSAHLEMGCVRGAQYWVQNSRTLEAERTSCGN